MQYIEDNPMNLEELEEKDGYKGPKDHDGREEKDQKNEGDRCEQDVTSHLECVRYPKNIGTALRGHSSSCRESRDQQLQGYTGERRRAEIEA